MNHFEQFQRIQDGKPRTTEQLIEYLLTTDNIEIDNSDRQSMHLLMPLLETLNCRYICHFNIEKSQLIFFFLVYNLHNILRPQYQIHQVFSMS